MVKKNQSTGEKSATKSRVNIGKVQLNKETIRDLTSDDLKKVDGGLVVLTIIDILIGQPIPDSGYCQTQTCGCFKPK